MSPINGTSDRIDLVTLGHPGSSAQIARPIAGTALWPAFCVCGCG